MSDDQDLEHLLSAAREDRPADDGALERRVLGAIAAGAVPAATSGKLAAFFGHGVLPFAIVLVGAGLAVWIATRDAHQFLAPARETPATSHSTPRVSGLDGDGNTAGARAAAPVTIPAAPVVHPATAPAAITHLRVPHAHEAVVLPITPTPPPTTAEIQRATPTGVRPSPVVAATETPSPSEISLLSHARDALRGRNMAALLVVVAEHDDRYPSGQFTEEFDLLRVEALAGTGQIVEARARAGQFARQWPGSPYTYRVRRAVGTETP